MNHSTSSVQEIYDKAYAHPGLMGTHFDREYSETTKTTLIALCRNTPNNRILDLGTGDGDLWQFVPTSFEWHGIDISQVGTKRAQTRFPRLNATVAISEDLPYPDDFFGAVIAADTMEHVFNVEHTLTEIGRIIAPGGTFALSVPAPESLRKWAYNRIFRQVPSLPMMVQLSKIVMKRQFLFGKAAFQPIDRDLSMATWCELLEKNGFKIAETIEWPVQPLTPIVYLIGTNAY